MIPLKDVRDQLVNAITAAIPAEVNLWDYPPEDVLETPAVWIELPTLNPSPSIQGGTVVTYPVLVVTTRSDHEVAYDRLEELTGIVWDALGGARGIRVAPAQTGKCTGADPDQITMSEATWAAMRIGFSVELGFDC